MQNSQLEQAYPYEQDFYFFLSYAHSREDGYVARFHEDLCRAVAKGLAEPPPPAGIGFRDMMDIRTGTRWRDVLQRALCRARTMVPLYCPEFFESRYCGREWKVFRDRMRLYEARENTFPAMIVPVLWKPVPRVPDVVEEIQFLHGEFPDSYRQRGMEYLVRQHRLGAEYRASVSLIAGLVLEAVRGHVLPVHDPFSIEEVVGDFGEGERPLPVPAGSGRRGHVSFFFAAGTRDTPPPHRNDLSVYGDDPLDWSPYALGPGAAPASLSVRAQGVVNARQYSSGLGVVDGALPDRLGAARARNEVVVLLVDPWATLMDHYQEPLSRFDRIYEPASGVLLPLHDGDPESTAHLDDLEAGVRRVFPRHVADQNPHFLPGVTSDRFDSTLGNLVTIAQNALIRMANPEPLLRPGTPRPILGAPPTPPPPEEESA